MKETQTLEQFGNCLSYTKHWNREIEDGVKVLYSLISEELWPQRFPKNRSLERDEQKDNVAYILKNKKILDEVQQSI